MAKFQGAPVATGGVPPSIDQGILTSVPSVPLSVENSKVFVPEAVASKSSAIGVLLPAGSNAA